MPETERRLLQLEGDMTDVKKCITRLETNYDHMTKSSDKVDKALFGEGAQGGMVSAMNGISTTQGHIITKLDAYQKSVNGGEDDDADKVTFKWILEKAAIPLLMSGTGAAIAFLVVKALSGG